VLDSCIPNYLLFNCIHIHYINPIVALLALLVPHMDLHDVYSLFPFISDLTNCNSHNWMIREKEGCKTVMWNYRLRKLKEDSFHKASNCRNKSGFSKFALFFDENFWTSGFFQFDRFHRLLFIIRSLGRWGCFPCILDIFSRFEWWKLLLGSILKLLKQLKVFFKRWLRDKERKVKSCNETPF